ncbi:MAG: S-layer homology domain-containing protein [Oscillibacter sp.]|nr:S-layer homology domain-containing protein [Oscillibacter sp.]
MKKRVLSLLLTLCMLLGLSPAMAGTASAANPTAGFRNIDSGNLAVPNERSEFSTQGFFSVNDRYWLVFYANDNDSAGIHLDNPTFSVAPGSPEVVVEPCQKLDDSGEQRLTSDGHPIWWVTPKEFGEGTLLITSGGVTYSMDYSVGLPNRGFFESADYTEASFFEDGTFRYEGTAQPRSFYFLTSSYMNASIRNISFRGTPGGYQEGDLTWEIAADGKMVTFTIPEGRSPEGWFYVNVDVEWENGNVSTWYEDIALVNNADTLRYQEVWYEKDHPYLDDASFTTLSLGSTYSTEIVFFHGTADNATALKNITVTSDDTDVMDVREVYEEPGIGTVVRLRGKDIGTTTLTVESEGQTYTLPVTVTLPDVGLYTERNATVDNFLYPYQYDSREDTVLWAMTKNGWEDPELRNVQNWKGHVNLDLVERDDKSGYYDVKITIPQGQSGGVEFQFDVRESDGSKWDNGFSLSDCAPALLFRYLDFYDDGIYEQNRIRTEFNQSLVSHPAMSFYYGTTDSCVPVTANSLAEAPVITVTPENSQSAPVEIVPVALFSTNGYDNVVAYDINLLSLGTAILSATIDSETYSMSATVGMPQFFPYTRREFVPDAILMDRQYDSTEETVLWMLTEEGLENPTMLSLDVWEGEIDWEFSERTDKAGFYDLKLTIPKDTVGEIRFNIEVEDARGDGWGGDFHLEDNAFRTRYHTVYEDYGHFMEEDYPHPMMNVALGYGRRVVFYYGNLDRVYPLTDLQFTVPQGLTVEQMEYTSTDGHIIYDIRGEGLDSYQLHYTGKYIDANGQEITVSDFLPVNVALPQFYPYTEREISLNAYDSEPEYVSGEEKVFWLMTESGHEGRPSIDLQRWQGRINAEPVERPDKPGYYDVKLTIPADAMGEINFYIHVRANNGGWGNSFRIQDVSPHLAWRWTSFDQDGNLYEDGDICTGPMWTSLNANNGLVLYYGSPDIGYTPVSCPTLDPSDAPEVTVTMVDGNGPAVTMTPEWILGEESRRVVYRMRGDHLGLSLMSVTIDGKTYSMQVVSQLPYVGFYSSDTISEQTILKDWMFTYTDTDRSFYLLSQQDGPIIETIEPIYYDSNSPSDFLTVEKVNDRAWKLTVKPDFDFDQAWLDVAFTGDWGNGSIENSCWGVGVANGIEAVRYTDFWVGPFGPEESDWAPKQLPLWVGDSLDVIFNYGTANNYAALTNITAVTPADSDLLSVEQVGTHTVDGITKPVFRVHALKCTSADENQPTQTSLNITADGQTYTFPISVYPIPAGQISYKYLFWDETANGYRLEEPTWLRTDDTFSSAPYVDMNCIALYFSPDGMSYIPVEGTIRSGTAYDMVSIKKDADGNDVTGWYEISAFDFTSGYLDVEVDGQTYSLALETHMPYLAFYSEPDMREDTFRMYNLMGANPNAASYGYAYYTELYTNASEDYFELADYHKFFALQKQYDADGNEIGTQIVGSDQFKAEILETDIANKRLKVGFYANTGDLLVFMHGYFEKDLYDAATDMNDPADYGTYINLLTPDENSNLFINLDDGGFTASKFLPTHLFEQAADTSTGVTLGSNSYSGTIHCDENVVNKIVGEMNKSQPVRIVMEDNPATNAQDAALDQYLGKNQKILSVLDLKLFSGDNLFGTTAQGGLGGNVTVTYACDLGLDNGTVVDVYYLDSNNNVKEKFSAIYTDGKLTFQTTHFSSFAISVPYQATVPEEMLGQPNTLIYAALYDTNGAMLALKPVPAGTKSLDLSNMEDGTAYCFFCVDKDKFIPLVEAVPSSNYQEAVSTMAVTGLLMDNFDADQPLTRGMAAQLICRLLLTPAVADTLSASSAPFKDVNASHPYAGAIAYCAAQGFISGYADGTFNPDGSLSGLALMKLLLGALGYDASAEVFVGMNWALNVTIKVKKLGLADGLKENFRGTAVVTQEEACLYAVNTLKARPVYYSAGGAVENPAYPTYAHKLFGSGLDALT